MIFSTTPTEDAAGERRCSSCGNALEEDQLACLECGSVTATGSPRERRWLLRTSTVAGAALLLVTSASFAATTALKSGDPHAMKPPPKPQVAQAPPAAIPPASGDGTAPAVDEKSERKKEDAAPAPAPAAPAPAATPAPAAPPATGGGGGNGSTGNGSGGENDSDDGGGTTDEEPPKDATLTVWENRPEGAWTVIVYRFPDKAGAKNKALTVASDDLAAGVILSDNYPSLERGSYLVFIGQFETQEQATAAQAKFDRAGYPGEVTFVGDAPADAPAQGAGQPGQEDSPAPTEP